MPVFLLWSVLMSSAAALVVWLDVSSPLRSVAVFSVCLAAALVARYQRTKTLRQPPAPPPLPLGREAIRADWSATAAPLAALTRGLVLVVDDDPISLEVMTANMRRHFEHVGTADSGRRAVEIFQLDHPEFVVLDYHMPGFSGASAIRAIRAMELENRDPPARIVVVTADVSAAAAEDCLSAGADAVFLKPYNFAQILATLRGTSAA